MDPLFELWKLAFGALEVVNGAPGNNRALTRAVESADTPLSRTSIEQVRKRYAIPGKTKTGPIIPNVGVPEANE